MGLKSHLAVFTVMSPPPPRTMGFCSRVGLGREGRGGLPTCRDPLSPLGPQGAVGLGGSPLAPG